MTTLLFAFLLFADPITPSQINDAVMVPPRGEKAQALAARIRDAYPKGTDFKAGTHPPLIEQGAVAFIVEAPAPATGPAPRVGGMVNHGMGLDLVPVGGTGLWLRVEPIPSDTKFAYHYLVGGKRIGGRTVEMPDWKYPPESSEQPGRAYGRYLPLKFRSKVFNNDRTGWLYVPAAYKGDGPPAALMVFQDGDEYKKERVGTVVENLIAAKAMPVTILLLLNPGINDDGKPNRSFEYDSLSNRYATFLETEAIPLAAGTCKLRNTPADRAIGGASSGGICAFTAAWERPDLFGRVCSQIGSFTNIRGGGEYPKIIRATAKKPIKVFLQDGTNDLINGAGDWWQANEAMFANLKEKGYEVEFLRDRGFHAYWSCGVRLPEALRKTWAGFTP